MHKLGAELGVKGMSLYNHVSNKDDLLDGVVEVLWTEVESAVTGAVTTAAGWHDGVRSFARALRAIVRRHPNAAPLIISHRVMPEPALRIIQAQIIAAVADSSPEGPAYDLLRTITSYALGSALAEAHWGLGETGCASAVSDLLRPGIPGDLVGVAEIFCGRGDPDAQFELGLDLMLRGLAAPRDPSARPVRNTVPGPG